MLGFAPDSLRRPASSGADLRAAAALLAEHGERAGLEIARRGDEALARGDVLLSARWGRLGRALDDLMRGEPRTADARA